MTDAEHKQLSELIGKFLKEFDGNGFIQAILSIHDNCLVEIYNNDGVSVYVREIKNMTELIKDVKS